MREWDSRLMGAQGRLSFRGGLNTKEIDWSKSVDSIHICQLTYIILPKSLIACVILRGDILGLLGIGEICNITSEIISVACGWCSASYFTKHAHSYSDIFSLAVFTDCNFQIYIHFRQNFAVGKVSIKFKTTTANFGGSGSEFEGLFRWLCRWQKLESLKSES